MKKFTSNTSGWLSQINYLFHAQIRNCQQRLRAMIKAMDFRSYSVIYSLYTSTVKEINSLRHVGVYQGNFTSQCWTSGVFIFTPFFVLLASLFTSCIVCFPRCFLFH